MVLPNSSIPLLYHPRTPHPKPPLFPSHPCTSTTATASRRAALLWWRPPPSPSRPTPPPPPPLCPELAIQLPYPTRERGEGSAGRALLDLAVASRWDLACTMAAVAPPPVPAAAPPPAAPAAAPAPAAAAPVADRILCLCYNCRLERFCL